MVKNGRVKIRQASKIGPEITEDLKWTAVSLDEILKCGFRLEASVYDADARQARENIDKCKWPKKNLSREFIQNASYPGRFKRIYVEKQFGAPFILPSQINEISPKPTKYISKATYIDFEQIKVKLNTILLTRSGTIGNCTIVSETLKDVVFSDDVIRIILRNEDEVGYIYAFLKSQTGNVLINTNNYGAVVSHIEPNHLENITVPDPSPIIKQQIHDDIMESFRLLDESNRLIDEAQELLKNKLVLPDIEDIHPQYFDKKVDLKSYCVPLSKLDGRIEATYHQPIVDKTEQIIKKNAREVTTVGDPRISSAIILPGRFKRIYVEEGFGAVFIGGKNVLENNPSNKKYLSMVHHEKRIKEQLTLKENIILVTCSGTIGKVNIVPKHWVGWTANQHMLRVVPLNDSIAGYLYIWLSSIYAFSLITRFTYGAVIDEIDNNHMARVPVPLLSDIDLQNAINDIDLDANQKRYEAYCLEQKALKTLDEKVIFAKGN